MRWLPVALFVSLTGLGTTLTCAATTRLAGTLGSVLGRSLGRAAAPGDETPAPVVIVAERVAEGVGLADVAELERARGRTGRVAAGPSSAARAHAARRNATRSRASNGGAGAARGRHRGIWVRAHTVLALAERGAQPGAVFVPARGPRPAGLALHGVSGLGLGLRDGDVLTEVSGRRVSAVGDVVALVIAARGRGASLVVGRVWRGFEPFQLAVEQPYPRKRGKSSAKIGPT